MPGYAAFLRAVNLGSHRRISNADLRALMEELGFEDVRPFRSSGNVSFVARKEAATKLAARIEQALEESFGHEVPVFLRTAGEIRAIADHQPFEPAQVKAATGKLQVTLLASRPATGKRKQVLALATEDDRLAFGERELYWLPSGGIRDSSLDSNSIAKLLGQTTVRTKGTIELMAAKHFTD